MKGKDFDMDMWLYGVSIVEKIAGQKPKRINPVEFPMPPQFRRKHERKR